MPTVLRFAGWRVTIYPNDHRPAHVHAIGKDCEAVFELNCPAGRSFFAKTTDVGARKSDAFAGDWSESLPVYAKNGSGFMVSTDEFGTANERARRQLRKTPPATAAHYDRKMGRVVVSLASGVDISFSPRDAEGLQGATATQLQSIEITPSGLGLTFPKLDADLYLPALLEGLLGSRKWMAARLGAIGGKRTTLAKRRASRANGRLGGRPKKAKAG
jgi:hypothetical protein